MHVFLDLKILVDGVFRYRLQKCLHVMCFSGAVDIFVEVSSTGKITAWLQFHSWNGQLSDEVREGNMIVFLAGVPEKQLRCF